jgi:hypothetical protein
MPYPGCFTPPNKNQYPSYRKLSWSQGISGRVWKISPPLEFDPRTVQDLLVQSETKLIKVSTHDAHHNVTPTTATTSYQFITSTH